MKKLLLLALFALGFTAMNAQVPSTSTPSKGYVGISDRLITSSYDSLRNINERNIMQLEGQTLLVLGTSMDKIAGFKERFFTTEYTKDPENQGKKKKKTQKYKEEISTSSNGKSVTTYTPFQAVAGKYFLIKKVTEHKYGTGISHVEYNLMLEERETKEILYMYLNMTKTGSFNNGSGADFDKNSYASVKRDAFSWIIMGYYEKLKQRYIGNEYYAKKTDYLKKYNSSGFVDVHPGEKFKCVDIGLNLGGFESFYAVFESKIDGKFCVKMDNDGKLKDFIDTREYSQFKKDEEYVKEMKALYIGKEFYPIQKKFDNYNKYIFWTKNDKSVNVLGTKLKCIDLELSPRKGVLYWIFENNEHEKLCAKCFGYYGLEHNLVTMKEYESFVSLYGKSMTDLAILKGEICIGMPGGLVVKIWGWPEKTNTTTDTYGKHEQFCYPDYKYLYFENGILTTIQE